MTDPKEVLTYLDNLVAKWDEKIWPCTIVASRYGGVYEGRNQRPSVAAFWLAFYEYPNKLDWDYILGDDLDCADWFGDHKDDPIGRGTTPDEAYSDLRADLVARCERGEHWKLRKPNPAVDNSYFCHYCRSRWWGDTPPKKDEEGWRQGDIEQGKLLRKIFPEET